MEGAEDNSTWLIEDDLSLAAELCGDDRTTTVDIAFTPFVVSEPNR